MNLVVGIPSKLDIEPIDLNLLLQSMDAYAPDLREKVKVFYTGNSPIGYGINVNVKRRDNQNGNFGDGCKEIITHTSEDLIFFLNDDTVFTPSTWTLLQEDLKTLEDHNIKWGMLGLRSNFSAGYQNIRRKFPNDPDELSGLVWPSETTICEVAQVFGVAFVVKRSSLEDITDDWTKLHWYGDNLLSYDLQQKGYRHFVSRAYIHHHGSRSGTDYVTYDKEGREWLKKHRPDFLKMIG